VRRHGVYKELQFLWARDFTWYWEHAYKERWYHSLVLLIKMQKIHVRIQEGSQETQVD